jgi:hypothetical protein
VKICFLPFSSRQQAYNYAKSSLSVFCSIGPFEMESKYVYAPTLGRSAMISRSSWISCRRRRAIFAFPSSLCAGGQNSSHSIAVKWWLTKITDVLLSLPLAGGRAFIDILEMVAG